MQYASKQGLPTLKQKKDMGNSSPCPFLCLTERTCGGVCSFIGQIENFIGQIESFIGQIENFIGQIESFIGQIESFIGQIENFIGQIESFIGQIENFIGQRYKIRFLFFIGHRTDNQSLNCFLLDNELIHRDLIIN